MSTALQRAVERAKRWVIRSGRPNVFAYVCIERCDSGDRHEFAVWSDAEYQANGREEDCVAAVWSYADGEYDAAGGFKPSGQIAAAVEVTR